MASGSSPEEAGYLSEVDTDQQDQGAVSSDQDANASASSTEGDNQDANTGSLLEAVQRAAKQEPSEQSSSSKGEEGEDADPDAAKEGEDADQAKEGEEETPPFHKHPRWQEVQRELKDLRPKAQMADQLQGFMHEAGLSTQEVNAGFELMRLMKHDPAQALQQLQPYLENLQQATGDKLPQDLQQDVEDGYVSEERAKEIARLRANEGRYRQQSEAQRRQAEEAQFERYTADLSNAVSDWERQWQQSDPDYARKAPRVQERLELKMLKGGVPSNTQEAIRLAEETRKEVERELAQFTPKRRPSTPVTGQGSVASRPEPSSMQEAMKMAARGEYPSGT